MNLDTCLFQETSFLHPLEYALTEVVTSAMAAEANNVSLQFNNCSFEYKDDGPVIPWSRAKERFNIKHRLTNKQIKDEFESVPVSEVSGLIEYVAKTDWHSGRLHIQTDYNSRESSYTVNRYSNYLEGLAGKGTFAEILSDSERLAIEGSLTTRFRYFPLNVRINQRKISYTEPVWTITEEKYNVRLFPPNTHGIHVYRGGLYVGQLRVSEKEFHADIQVDPSIPYDTDFRRILDTVASRITLLDDNFFVPDATDEKISEENRRALVNAFLSGDIACSSGMFLNLKLFRDCCGNVHDIHWLIGPGGPFSVSPSVNNKHAKRIADQGVARILDPDELALWGAKSVCELVSKVVDATRVYDEGMAFDLSDFTDELQVTSYQDVLKEYNLA